MFVGIGLMIQEFFWRKGFFISVHRTLLRYSGDFGSEATSRSFVSTTEAQRCLYF